MDKSTTKGTRTAFQQLELFNSYPTLGIKSLHTLLAEEHTRLEWNEVLQMEVAVHFMDNEDWNMIACPKCMGWCQYKVGFYCTDTTCPMDKFPARCGKPNSEPLDKL